MGKSTISMAIFNCYLSSPEGSGARVACPKNEGYRSRPKNLEQFLGKWWSTIRPWILKVYQYTYIYCICSSIFKHKCRKGQRTETKTSGWLMFVYPQFPNWSKLEESWRNASNNLMFCGCTPKNHTVAVTKQSKLLNYVYSPLATPKVISFCGNKKSVKSHYRFGIYKVIEIKWYQLNVFRFLPFVFPSGNLT